MTSDELEAMVAFALWVGMTAALIVVVDWLANREESSDE